MIPSGAAFCFNREGWWIAGNWLKEFLKKADIIIIFIFFANYEEVIDFADFLVCKFADGLGGPGI